MDAQGFLAALTPAVTDADARERFLADPKAVLATAGLDLPGVVHGRTEGDGRTHHHPPALFWTLMLTSAEEQLPESRVDVAIVMPRGSGQPMF